MKLFAPICAVTLLAAALLAEDVPPARPGEPPVVLFAGVSAESLPAASQPSPEPPPAPGRANPFAPSPRLNGLAQPATATQSEPPAAIGILPPPAQQPAAALPTIEGVMVRDGAVLICFRHQGATLVVKPGQTFGPPAAPFLFVSFRNEAATIQDAAGRLFQVRSQSGTFTPKPAQPTPAVLPTD